MSSTTVGLSKLASVPRCPLINPLAETERVDRYWQILAATQQDLLAASLSEPEDIVAEDQVSGLYLVRITSELMADYESLHLEHRLGLNWQRYNRGTAVYSLRDSAGIHNSGPGRPVATLVLDGDAVVFCREERHARLSPRHQKMVARLCHQMAWRFLPPPLPIDVGSSEGVNTFLLYCFRRTDNTKCFQNVVISDPFKGAQKKTLMIPFHVSARFVPALLDLPDIGGVDSGHHEAILLCGTNSPPSNAKMFKLMCSY